MSSNIVEMRREVRGLMGDLTDFRTTVMEVNRALSMYVALGGKLGLPPQATEAIRTLMRVYYTVMLLYRGMLMLQVASGPIGWLMAGASLLGGGVGLAEQFHLMGAHY